MKELQGELNKLFQITHPNASRNDLEGLYKRLISEEYKELTEESSGTSEDFKELCDLIWVCIQYANACDYDLEAGMRELIKEYESKFYTKEGEYQPMYREDGKLLKNTGFKKADFSVFFIGKQQ